MDELTIMALMMAGVKPETLVKVEIAVKSMKIRHNSERKVYLARDRMESESADLSELSKLMDLDKNLVAVRTR